MGNYTISAGLQYKSTVFPHRAIGGKKVTRNGGPQIDACVILSDIGWSLAVQKDTTIPPIARKLSNKVLRAVLFKAQLGEAFLEILIFFSSFFFIFFSGKTGA